jgi:hypothetical protein
MGKVPGVSFFGKNADEAGYVNQHGLSRKARLVYLSNGKNGLFSLVAYL